MKFMENQEQRSCVLGKAIKKMDADTCKSMSGLNLFDFRIKSGDGTTEITPKVGTQMKFDLNTYKEVSISPTDSFLATTLNSGACSCDNVVLEAHFKVYFDFFDLEKKGNSWVIKDIAVDTVYGTTQTDACTNPKHYQLKTSVTYL